MSEFKFSVVIAAYNSDLWIAKTINSLINQTIDFEKEIADSFDLEYIKHLIKTLSEKELKEKSEGYSKELRKYRL